MDWVATEQGWLTPLSRSANGIIWSACAYEKKLPKSTKINPARLLQILVQNTESKMNLRERGVHGREGMMVGTETKGRRDRASGIEEGREPELGWNSLHLESWIMLFPYRPHCPFQFESPRPHDILDLDLVRLRTWREGRGGKGALLISLPQDTRTTGLYAKVLV